MLSLNLSLLPQNPHLSPHCLSSKTSIAAALIPLPPRRRRSSNLRQCGLQIRALDAAQPFDYEAKLAVNFQSSTKLKIAVIGFGNFGQFLAKTFVRQGHEVLAHSRTDYSKIARRLGVTFFSDADDLCEEHPEVIVLCTSILSTKAVLKSLPLKRLKRRTLFVDVLSVKEFPKKVMTGLLPNYFDILCTHPMFGPESGKDSWHGLNFVFDKVRIGAEESRVSRCEKFLEIFEKEGCRMVSMACEEHDKYAAESQFITHTVGRILEALGLEPTPINTKGYETLLDLVDNTSADSFDLYYGLFMYNAESLDVLDRFDLALESLRSLLFTRMHDVIREQLFGRQRRPVLVAPKDEIRESSSPVSSSLETARSQNLSLVKSDKLQIFGGLDKESRLKIGIIGFGNFGQFLAKTFVRQGHTVMAYSRSDYSEAAQSLGVYYFSDVDDLCEEHPEVIIICTSILSTEKVLASLPLERLKRSTLFVDVLSVKEFPKNLFLENLPQEFDILCTHPMFGPESGKSSWNSLTFVYDKVRIGDEESRVSRCHKFLEIFAREGCQMVEMPCEEHDKYAAGSQFITHTMGRILERLVLRSTPINTKGYETLLDLVSNTAGDSFDLYYGLFVFNVNATNELQKLENAYRSLMKQLLGILHKVHRKRLFENGDNSLAVTERRLLLLAEKVSVPESSSAHEHQKG